MSTQDCLYDVIKESFLLLDFGDRRFFERHGLSVSRYYALHHIAGNPGLSPSRLSQLMFCDKSNITRLLQGLEHEGYVERRRHEQDARIQRLYLTEAGARLHGGVCVAHRGYIEQRLAALPFAASEQVVATLTSLNNALSSELVG